MSKRSLSFLALVIVLTNKDTNAKQCSSTNSKSNIFLSGFVFESTKVDTTLTCTLRCLQNEHCRSINMNFMNMICELNNSTKTKHPQNIARQLNMFYMEIRGDNAAQGSRQDIPISSCKKLKENDSQAKSGVYWMKLNDPSSEPFQVFCEMTIDGGGWTLVYSYTFTKYNVFQTSENAVTPIPNWPVDKYLGIKWVSQSTKTPLSESSRSAMDFTLWKKIGNEFLAKSNIINWVACVEGTGSLVNWVDGSLTCKVVKAITPTCTTVAPNRLQITFHCGPSLRLNNGNFIFLDGRTDGCWPAHFPCGTSSGANHLTNVSSPGGVIYIR